MDGSKKAFENVSRPFDAAAISYLKPLAAEWARHKIPDGVLTGFKPLKYLALDQFPLRKAPHINLVAFPTQFGFPHYLPKAELLDSIRPLLSSWASRLPYPEHFERLYKRQKHAELLSAAGWLPHETTPVSLLADDTDPETLSQALSDFYDREWKAVRRVLEKNLSELAFDDECRDCYGEAFRAHEAGLYRCVTRLMFPEIERITRVKFGRSIRSLASVRDLRELAGEMPLSQIGIENFKLFEKLYSHLYAHVDSDEQLVRFAGDPIPNRHAAIHGLIPYSSQRSSLNTLFMADYILEVASFGAEELQEGNVPGSASAA